MKFLYIAIFMAASVTLLGADVLKPAVYPNDWRLKTSEDFTAQAARLQKIQLVFLGDSITQGWTSHWVKENGCQVWAEEFKPYGKVNFGLSSDRIENVLWRITEGKQLDNYKAQIVILMIGANNFSKKDGNTNEEIASGIKNLVTIIREKQPETKVLLLGMLPISWWPGREAEVNQMIKSCADEKRVFFLDMSPQFLDENGKTKTAILHDGIHPNHDGYKVMADIIIPKINELLKAE